MRAFVRHVKHSQDRVEHLWVLVLGGTVSQNSGSLQGKEQDGLEV